MSGKNPFALAACVAVALLALSLRLWHLELATFSSDEAVLLLLSEDLVKGVSFPLAGPLSSVGLSTPGHFMYLVAPVVAIARAPEATAGFLAVLGTVGVVASMVLAWRAFGPVAGVLTGLIFAVNPTAVAYSRRIWQPSPIPELAALALLALDLAIVNRRKWWAAATLPIATLATLLHTSFAPLAIFVVPPALYLLRNRRRWLALVVSVLATVLLVVPFVVYEFQTAWKDYPNLRYYSSLHSFVDLEALRWLVAVTTGWLLPNDAVVPPPQRVMPSALVDGASLLALLLLAVATAFAVVTVVRPGSPPSRITRVRLGVLVLWLLLPALFSIRHWQPLFLHYFFYAFPAAALLVAFAVSASRPVLRPIGYAALALVIGVQGFNSLGGNAYEAAAAGSDPCFFESISLVQARAYQVAQLGHAAQSNAAVMELDAGDSKALAYLLRADFPSIYLPHPVTSSQTPKMFGNIGLGAAQPSQSLAPGSASVPPVLTATQQFEARFPNGVTAHTAAFSTDSDLNQRVQVALAWSVDPNATATRPVVWRTALLDSEGELVQNDSGDSFVPAARKGDSAVSWFQIDTRREVAPDQRAPGPYTLRLELVDTSGDPPSGLFFSDASGTSKQHLDLPVRLRAFEPCDLPSTIP